MAKIETKTEAVIHLTVKEVDEIRGWFSVIDWDKHPLAQEIYAGLGGDLDAPNDEGVDADVEYGLVQFSKED